MKLNKKNLPKIQVENTDLQMPALASFHYPEKIIEFGTGVLLRALPNFYINKSNIAGEFKGRIVVIKSTNKGDTTNFLNQDNLYTNCIRGFKNNELVKENIINNSISRVIEATNNWEEILMTAEDENINIIISNTTEAGIQLEESDNINEMPPKSFPGKLLAILKRRFESCQGNSTQGFIILPTELIPHNGELLKEYILKLAIKNKLSENCIQWIKNANFFCNTLVDRIVPGVYKEKELKYEDDLMIMAEPFGLWAIETDKEIVKQKLSFANMDKGIVLTENIEKFKELKLRLLNGSHSLSCALAILANFETVKQSMQNPIFKLFVKNLLIDEIGQAIQSKIISQQEIEEFSLSVLDRFSNPFLAHEWTAISSNYTEKIRLRCLPILKMWNIKNQTIPSLWALGFAAYLLLEISDFKLNDNYQETIKSAWKQSNQNLSTLLQQEIIWGEDLTKYIGLVEKIRVNMDLLNSQSVMEIITNMQDLK